MKIYLIIGVVLLAVLYKATLQKSETIAFEAVSVPITPLEKKTIRTTTTASYKNGKSDSISFMKIIAAKERDNGELFALLKDSNDIPITLNDGSPLLCDSANGNASGAGVDHSSIIKKNGRIFMISQFECAVGAMYGMELEQNVETGALTLKRDTLHYISQKDGFGGWIHCSGITTPWESHLGSEEYEPDARVIEADKNTTTLLTGNRHYDEVTKYYWRDENGSNSKEENNPYYYGHIPEVSIDATNQTPQYKYVKHFSMGRAAWEMAYVMPDKKTLYLSDDGVNVGFYMYIADRAEDLSSGTLYAVKWIQTSATQGGAADLQWIKLGHATDAEIRKIVANHPKFSDIFRAADVAADGSCPQGFTSIHAGSMQECLQLKSGKESAAAFLETRRYAALLGATTEFRKEEGITFNPDKKLLYVSMSQVRQGMENGSSQDIGGNNDIQLASNACGAVYAMQITTSSETAKDKSGATINSSYVVKNTRAEVVGQPATYEAGTEYEAYTCSVNGIANPDNITYLAGKNTLIIGEDTSAHPNDFVWSYDTVTKKLTRIVTLPYGSEATSPFWYQDMSGFSYLTLVVQHPFGEVDVTELDYKLKADASEVQQNSSVGLIGPFKNW